MKYLKTVTSLVVASLCSTACSFKAPKEADFHTFETASVEEKSVLLSRLGDYSSEVQSLQATIQVEFEHSLGKNRKLRRVHFVRPDRIRLDSPSSAKSNSNVVILHRSAAHAVDYQNKVLYRGTTNQHNIERLITIPLLPNEIMMWLVGRYEPPKKTKKGNSISLENTADTSNKENEYQLSGSKAFISREERRAALELRLEDGRTITLVTAIDGDTFSSENENNIPGVFSARGKLSPIKEPLPIESIEVHRDGRRIFLSKFEYDKLQLPPGELLLPSKIEFWCFEQEIHGTLRFQEQSVNPDFGRRARGLFSGENPPLLKKWYLDHDRGEEFDAFF